MGKSVASERHRNLAVLLHNACRVCSQFGERQGVDAGFIRVDPCLRNADNFDICRQVDIHSFNSSQIGSRYNFEESQLFQIGDHIGVFQPWPEAYNGIIVSAESDGGDRHCHKQQKSL